MLCRLVGWVINDMLACGLGYRWHVCIFWNIDTLLTYQCGYRPVNILVCFFTKSRRLFFNTKIISWLNIQAIGGQGNSGYSSLLIQLWILKAPFGTSSVCLEVSRADLFICPIFCKYRGNFSVSAVLNIHCFVKAAWGPVLGLAMGGEQRVCMTLSCVT